MLIVEEGAPGGFAAHVLAWMANAGRLDDGVAVRALTLPDRFVDHDSQSGQLALAGLDAAGIERGIAACSIGQRPANRICAAPRLIGTVPLQPPPWSQERDQNKIAPD